MQVVKEEQQAQLMIHVEILESKMIASHLEASSAAHLGRPDKHVSNTDSGNSQNRSSAVTYAAAGHRLAASTATSDGSAAVTAMHAESAEEESVSKSMEMERGKATVVPGSDGSMSN